MKEINKVTVLGAGAWGTSLAAHLAGKGIETTLWMREEEVRLSIEERRVNDLFLPGTTLPENLTPTNDLKSSVEGAQMIIGVVPSHGIRGVFAKVAQYISKDTVIVNTSKGIEVETGLTGSAILAECGLTKLVVLSGPTFAKEVADGLPCALSAASDNEQDAKLVQETFGAPGFRVYTNNDILGVEYGGALKNVIALAAGISDGLALGTNARAALITRGLKEISRLGVHMGAKTETFYGLSGVGDLVLTCTGGLSRNRSVGERIGKGETLTEIIDSMKMVAEGVKTSKATLELARREKVAMPITEEINKVLYENKAPRTAVMDLMTRELRVE
ncbi:MAG: NAD(P)-dependent glycerol-3-phosphate dehydrogenase [Proteobacteria bacterium]|nr:NAD(P)-dependent glycerol-3-phosphate dehydrogenase [Pseudomonadota bacterium]